jgi:hypothetical protein
LDSVEQGKDISGLAGRDQEKAWAMMLLLGRKTVDR